MRRAAWDIEIVFDPTYAAPLNRPYIARAYPSGSRRMAYMLEAAATQEEALAQMQERIAAQKHERPAFRSVVTVQVDDDGVVLR